MTNTVSAYLDLDGEKREIGVAHVDLIGGCCEITVTDPEAQRILQGSVRDSFSIEQEEERGD